MGRPPLWRRVDFIPEITYFKPAGIPLAQLQEVRLSVEEAEAIRLKDIEKLEQEECAQKMNISRTTFARVLTLARQKVADALLNGKGIRIEGGNFEMAARRFRCINGHEWDVPFEVMTNTPAQSCPTCDTPTIMPVWPRRLGWGRGGQGRRRGRGRNWKGGDEDAIWR
jgi:predicted DNA-binding protein (UPF0251 family)